MNISCPIIIWLWCCKYKKKARNKNKKRIISLPLQVWSCTKSFLSPQLPLLPVESGAHMVVTISIGDAQVGVHGIGVVDNKLASLAIMALLDK